MPDDPKLMRQLSDDIKKSASLRKKMDDVFKKLEVEDKKIKKNPNDERAKANLKSLIEEMDGYHKQYTKLLTKKKQAVKNIR